MPLYEDGEVPEGIKKLKDMGCEIVPPKNHLPGVARCVIAAKVDPGVGADVPKIEDGMLEYLLEDKRIEGLYIDARVFFSGIPSIDIGDGVLRDLPKLTHLKHLTLIGVDLDSVELLDPLDNLVRLYLFSEIMIPDLVADVESLSHLKHLRLRQSQFIPEAERGRIRKMDIEQLARLCPNLETFHYRTYETFDLEALKAFAEFSKLKTQTIGAGLRIRQDIILTEEQRRVEAQLKAYLQENLPKGSTVSIAPQLVNWKQLEIPVPPQRKR